MPQIFTPAADTWLRATVAAVFLTVFFGGLFGSGLARSSYLTRRGWPVHQPVPFSHKHHAGDLGIDCRYCHSQVEQGRYAGIPSSHTCMTCHSQIWTGAPVLEPLRRSFAAGEPIPWRRVSGLPEYVYFDHHIHIARGVPCVACHGRVDEMPLAYRAEALQMRFCISCHRDPAPWLRPPDQVTRTDWSAWLRTPGHETYGVAVMRAHRMDPAKLTDCAVCHR